MSQRERIEHKLADAFHLDHLEVIDESHQHNVPPGAESHFKVTIVSPDFDGQGLLVRHRAVNRVLHQELAGSVHALALHTYTADEWRQRGGAPGSPPCLGGGRG